MSEVKKAWKLTRSKMSYEYMFDERVVYADKANIAKLEMLKELKHEAATLKNGDDVSYINVPIRRCVSEDLIEYKGRDVVRYELNRIIERESEMKGYKEWAETGVKHCYILKRGEYYRPNSSGYTSRKTDAGVYNIEDAINSCKSCDELSLLKVDVDEHNANIKKKIEALTKNLIET